VCRARERITFLQFGIWGAEKEKVSLQGWTELGRRQRKFGFKFQTKIEVFGM